MRVAIIVAVTLDTKTLFLVEPLFRLNRINSSQGGYDVKINPPFHIRSSKKVEENINADGSIPKYNVPSKKYRNG